MGLAWSWLHWTVKNLIVDFELRLDQLWKNVLDLFGEGCKEGIHNCAENLADSFETDLSVSDDVKVTLKTLSQFSATTTWLTHSRADNVVDNGEPWLFLVLTIVPTAEVKELTDQLNWWLSTELFLLRHVKIIDEDDELLAERWTPAVLSTFFVIGLQVILSLIGGSLGREAHNKG